MPQASDDEAHVSLGTVLCPSGRLTICDWVATGAWSPRRHHYGSMPDTPRVSTQTACNTDGAVVEGLRPDVAYPVSGRFLRDERGHAILSELYVTIRDGIAAERADIGTASVQHGRTVVVDAALDLDWADGISADGLADVAFWGRHGAEVAVRVGAGPLTSPGEVHGVFGWRDLPLAEAERIARDLEVMRSQEKAFAVDLRPHTEQWRHLENLRQSRTGSIAIEGDGARLILFSNDFGHHLCFIGADLDAAGHVLRAIIDLERDPFEQRCSRTIDPQPLQPTSPTTRIRVGTRDAARDTTEMTGSGHFDGPDRVLDVGWVDADGVGREGLADGARGPLHGAKIVIVENRRRHSAEPVRAPVPGRLSSSASYSVARMAGLTLGTEVTHGIV